MLRPKKSLGQNFLRDENILRKIVENLDLQKDDVVIEIGSGQGALTKRILEKPVKLIGVEVDERAVQLLHERFSEKLEIVHSSILDINLMEVANKHGRNVRVVGNIPYYLTSEILFWLFDASTFVNDAMLMMQLEVARRLVAPPKNKEYGILSVFTQFFTDCEMLFKVSRNSFFPVPEVDSAVVSLKFKKILPKCNKELFRSVVRSTFGKRRKTLRNGLKTLGFNGDELNHLNLDLTKRPEDLSVIEFIVLTNSLDQIAK